MADCPKCGLPVAEGESFCNACGARLPRIVKQEFCPVCGNTVLEGAVRCNLCGTVLGGGTASAAEEIAKQQENVLPPSMDEISDVPIITDEMLGLNETPVKKEDMPTMDSIEMPGMKKPASKPQNNAPSPVALNKPQQKNTAPVIPEQQPTVNIQKPQGTPPQQNNFAQPPQGGQFGQQNNFAQPPQGGQFGQPNNFAQPPQGGQFGQPNNFAQPPQGGQFGQPNNFAQPPQGGQFGPQNNFAQPPQGGQFGQPNNFAQPPQGGQFGQPNNFGQPPQGGQFGQPVIPQNGMPNAKPSKPTKQKGEGLSTVNKILIALIALVAIAALLIFVVFKDKIFNGEKSAKSISVVTMLEENSTY